MLYDKAQKRVVPDPTTPPPAPGWKWAGDPNQPQRSDTDEYRRKVFRGEITPDGRAAVDGVPVATGD